MKLTLTFAAVFAASLIAQPYNGTTVGTVTLTSGFSSTSGASGFSGANYISLPVAALYFAAGADYTLEARINSSSCSGGTRVALGSGGGVAVWFGALSSGNFAASVPGTGYSLIDSGFAVCDGTTHHVAVVVSGGGTAVKLFVDGQQRGSTATGSSAATLNGSGDTGAIGNLPAGLSSFAWLGAVDEVAIWNTAKYTGSYTVPSAAYTGSEANLKALYHLDTNANDSVSSGGGPPLTISGAYTENVTSTGTQVYFSAASGGTPPYTYAAQVSQYISYVCQAFATASFTGIGSPLTISGLASSTTHCARIQVTDSLGATAVSNTPVFTTLAGSGTLTAGTLSAGSPASTSVPLTWTAATNCAAACTYQVQTATASGGPFTNFGSAGSGLSSTVTGLTAATAYWFRLSINDGTSTVTSNVVTATTTAGGGNPYDTVDGITLAGGEPAQYYVPNSSSAVPYSTGASAATLVIYFHGAAEWGAFSGDNCGWGLNPDKAAMRNAIANAGWIVGCTRARGDAWGTQASVQDYVRLYRDALTRYPNITRVTGICQSMGCIPAAIALAQSGIPLRGVASIYGAYNLAQLQSTGPHITAINAAHGITGSGTATFANMTAGLDPLALATTWATAFKHIPWAFWHSGQDSSVPKDTNTDAFRALIYTSTFEANVTQCSTTGGHGDLLCFDPPNVVAFFNRALAASLSTSGQIGSGGGGTRIY